MTFSSPIVSIIIPTFNSGSKLSATLNSIVFQNCADFEILIMDGASIDETLEVVNFWINRDARISFWSEPDKGVYDAMNKGIGRAKGRYLYFMGAGDQLRPGVMEKIIALLPDDASSLFYGRIWKVSHEIEYGSHFEFVDLARRNLPHQAQFFGREIFEALGKYKIEFPIQADYEFNIRCFGASWIRRRYLDFIICDFEEGGLSDTCRDETFLAQKSVLVRRELGIFPALVLWADQHLPSSLQRTLGRIRQNVFKS